MVIPTIHNAFEELRPSLQSILACEPAELMLVTTHDKRKGLQRLADSLGHPNIRVLDTAIANKRIQVCEALPKVTTRITIMADDDVTWPSTLIPWILAPFEDDQIGGVGTCQRVKREFKGPWTTRAWNWLGAAYIERRNFEISATHNIDGGTSCMSGRTGAYRSEILMSHEFLSGFKNEKWRKWILNADDDNFVTRWLVSQQWKTWIQYERECEVETTLENSAKFLYQCSRWARSNWRSNWTSLVTERYIWKYVHLPLICSVKIPLTCCIGSNGGAPMPFTSPLSPRWHSSSIRSSSSLAGGLRRVGTCRAVASPSGPSSSSCLPSLR